MKHHNEQPTHQGNVTTLPRLRGSSKMEIIENEQLSVSMAATKIKPMSTAQYFSPKSQQLQSKLKLNSQQAQIAHAIVRKTRMSDLDLPNKLTTIGADDSRLKDMTQSRVKALKFSKEVQKYASQSRMVKKDLTKSKLISSEIAEAACESSPMANSQMEILEGHKLFAFTETVTARHPLQTEH